eukprot:514549-Hanusia_phi.AAC.2
MPVETGRADCCSCHRCFSMRARKNSHSPADKPAIQSSSSRRALEGPVQSGPQTCSPTGSPPEVSEIVQELRRSCKWMTPGSSLSSWSNAAVNLIQVNERIVVMGDIPTDSGRMVSSLSSSAQVSASFAILRCPPPHSQTSTVVKDHQAPEEPLIDLQTNDPPARVGCFSSLHEVFPPPSPISSSPARRDMRSLLLLLDWTRRKELGSRWGEDKPLSFVLYDSNGLGAAGMSDACLRLSDLTCVAGVLSCVLLLALGGASSALDALLHFIDQRTIFRVGQAGDPNVVKKFRTLHAAQQEVSQDCLAEEFVIVGPISRWITPSMQRYLQYFAHAQKR